MKFYVTGRSSNFEQVKVAFAKIKEMGHLVTFEWTALPMVKPYSANLNKAAEFSVAGIRGVIESDVYLIFTHEDGNGVFTEFGAALAAYEMGRTIRIIAIGNRYYDSAMFLAHPAIEWFQSLEDVFDELGL